MLLCLPLFLGFAAKEAQAQTATTFVSNTGQTSAGTSNHGTDRAQSFTTGSHAAGYTLTSVTFPAGTNLDTGRTQIHIRQSGSNSRPSDSLGTLTLTRSSGEVTGTTDGIDLAAGTTYFVTIESTDANGFSTYQRTASDNEDAGAAAGWSIGDTSFFHSAHNELPNWATAPTSQTSWMISIQGTAKSDTASEGVTLSESDLTLTELGSSSDSEKTYTVVLDTDPGANVVVTVTSGDPTAVAVDTDSVTAGDQDTLTFTTSNYSQAQTVTLRAVNDGDTAAETFNISHAAAVTDTNNPYHQIPINNVSVTTVDAGHGVTVSKASLSVAENSDTDTYTIKLKSEPGGSVVITPTSSATANATVSGPLTFTSSNWSTAQTVTVTGAGAGSATISHAVTTGTTAYPTSTTIASVAVTVTAVAVIPELTFGSATYSGAEDGGTIDVTVNADTAPSSALTVNLTAANGTATGGTDFTAPGATFTFPASTTSHTISVSITDDLLLENNETFTLTLGDGTGYTVGTQTSTTVTITDQDTVTIELAASTYTVLENGTLNVTVRITSTPRSADIPVSLTLTPTDGTATGNSSGTGAGIDYDNDAQTLTIASGVSQIMRTIAINDDTDQEVDETFTLALSTTQARVSVGTRSSATVTIADNDRAQGLVFTPASVTVDEGASATYTVRPTTAPTSDVTVSVTVPGSTDLSIDTRPNSAGTSTQALTFTTLNWQIGQPIEVTASQDPDAVNDMVTLTHSPSGGGYSSTHDADLMVTIEDDDIAVPVISVSLPSGESEMHTAADELIRDESEGGTGLLITVSADQQLASALTACIRITESGADRVASGDEGIKTVSLTSSGNNNGSGTRTLRWTDTPADDRDSSVTIEVIASNTNGCSATNGSYTVSSSDPSDKLLIKDDESTTVELTSSDTSMTEGLASATATLTVELSRRLYAGEVIVVPLTLASSTGARLPGSTNSGTANHDFTVAAEAASGHSNVTIANQQTATPSLTFTGHETNTVQGATVTLTPVAGRDDGDMIDETITATLATDSVLGATGTGTTVSGGVSRHASNYMASLTLAEPGTPGITLSTAGPLRLLETGTASYTVVLDAAPTHDVRVSVARIGAMLGAASTDHTILTFTTENWSRPQTVTVRGVDESGRHRNRSLDISHGVNSTDTRYGNLSNTNLRVNVDDAPEVEAWWYIKGNARIQRPHTVTSTPGLKAWQNAAPGDRLPYVVRLSNRPEPGGTVTVTATVPSDKTNLVGLSLTEGGAPENTVTVEFKDRSPGAGTGCSNWLGLEENKYLDSNGIEQNVRGGGKSESYDGTADTPWECWRMIYVVRKPASRNIDDTCADITHTATGGGVRKVTVDTIRAHVRNPGRNRRGSRGYESQCRNLTGNTLPQNSPAPAQAASEPTEKISNLQVTEVDATSVSVTWDAVAYATSYDVSWSAESSDSLNASAGALPGVTGTTTTIQHDASVPMTLTVTVTPEYIDKNGVTKQLDALAGEATLAIGPSGQRLDSGGGTNDGNGGSIDSGEGAVDFPVPVSHWRFEYDAVDWVGSSHGTESGGVAFVANEEGEGVDDHALSLDGSDDYVDLSTHVSDFPLGDSTRSVTGWFKADAGNQRQTFFTYGPNVAGKRFSIAADRTQVLVAVSGHAWGVNGLELQEGWHHVAVTYAGGDSDDILIYLDGELQSASTLVGSPKRLDTGTGPAAIGRNVGGTKHYTGLIDDVRLYDVALSAEHVLALFDEHTQTPPSLVEDNLDEPEPSEQSIEADDEEADDGAVDLPDPVSHWSFDNDAVDGAGSSHGTVSGGAAFAANEDSEGVGSHALSLDGSNDHVDLDLHVSNFPLGDSARSVTGWFKADTGNQGQSFFSYGPNVAGKRFSIAADRTQALVGVSGHGWGVTGLNLQEGWHHVAVTYAGGKSDAVLIYLDGELQSALTLAGSPKRLNTGIGPAAIGQNVGGTKHYAGSIDDVRLYDVALSAEQVRALFDEHPQL